MRTGIMQPYFFPYIGYFQLINVVDFFVLYDDVTYIKGGWINRNRVYERGVFHYWTMPLHNSSSNRLIKDIEFIRDGWTVLLKTLRQNYSKAPYFEAIYGMVETIADNEEVKTIVDLNQLAIQTVCDYLGIKTPIYRSSELNVHDGSRVERLVKICKLFNCDTYINAEGGQELYKKDDFSWYGVSLYFIRSTPVVYKQFTDMPVENLSIIDVMMFNSREKVRKFLNNNYVLR
jgi:hypothetical protein